MPSKKKPAAAGKAALPSIPKELIDQFVQGPMSAEAVNAASMAFKKALIERALGAELSHHLGYPPGATKPEEAGNHRNGSSGKTVLTEDGPLRNWRASTCVFCFPLERYAGQILPSQTAVKASASR